MMERFAWNRGTKPSISARPALLQMYPRKFLRLNRPTPRRRTILCCASCLNTRTKFSAWTFFLRIKDTALRCPGAALAPGDEISFSVHFLLLRIHQRLTNLA